MEIEGQPPQSQSPPPQLPTEAPPIMAASPQLENPPPRFAAPAGPNAGASAPRRRSSSRGLWIFLIMVCSLAAVAVLGFGTLLKSFTGTPFASGREMRYHESIIEDNDSRKKILLIDLGGLISDSPIGAGGKSLVGWIKDQLESAEEDGSIKGVILRVDSPGGEVLASDEIYRLIEKFQNRSGKPVVASLGSVAASGGYYVAAPCRWIVANELTITGSIGVILQTYNYRQLMDKVGVRSEVFKSGRFKDMLSGDKDSVSPEERAMVQTLVNESFDRFKGVVRTGRASAAKANRGDGRPLTQDWADYADGRIFSGRQAHELGFVDELGNFQTAYQRMLRLASIESANVIQYHLEFGIADFLGFLGKTPLTGLKIDWGVELPRVQAGKMYFLAPSLVR